MGAQIRTTPTADTSDTAAPADSGAASEFVTDSAASEPVDAQQAWNDQYSQAEADKVEALKELVAATGTIGKVPDSQSVDAIAAAEAKVKAAQAEINALNANPLKP